MAVKSIHLVGRRIQPYLLATVPARGLNFYRPTADGLELVTDFVVPGIEVAGDALQIQFLGIHVVIQVGLATILT